MQKLLAAAAEERGDRGTTMADLFRFQKPMRIHDIKDGEGRNVAFEVNNTFLGRRGACRVAKRIPGARVLRSPKFLSFEEEFCEFIVGDTTFKVWEPFGDNSRYWIGPVPTTWVPEIELVREAFARAAFLVYGVVESIIECHRGRREEQLRPVGSARSSRTIKAFLGFQA